MKNKVPKQQSVATVKRLLSYAKPYGLQFTIALITSLISVALTLLTPVLIGRAIDYMIGANNIDLEQIIKYILYIAVCTAGVFLSQWLLSVSTNSMTYKMSRDIRKKEFDTLLHLPLSYVDGSSRGDIIARLSSDIEKVCEGLFQTFTQLFTGAMTILGTIIVMLILNPLLALVVIVITPLSLFIASYIAKRSSKMFREQALQRGVISGNIEEIFAGQKIVQAFNYQNKASEKFEKENDKLYYFGVRAQYYSAMTNPCTRFINNLVYAFVGTLGAILAITAGTVTAGTLSSFLMFSNQYAKPFNEITGVLSELQTAVSSAKRIFDFIDAPQESSDASLPKLENCDGTVKLENVYFSYTPERPLIQDVNLNVKNGMKIAIVGPTGCGKTTLINLLMRFYEVNQGAIKVSDANVNEVQRNSLRDCFGMVLQDSWLFHGTIRENIAYGKMDASDEEIVAAAELAGAHSFIMATDNGYDTVIGENGDNISTGQKQLLCIARIMLLRPSILILDEATSNIDTRTEIKIQNAFAKIMEGRTTFIVAHRLSTIKNADLILVMKDGNIVEQGSHNELIEQDGFYKELYTSQFAVE